VSVRRVRFALVAAAVLTALAILTVLTPGAVAVDLPSSGAGASTGQLAIEVVDADSDAPLAMRARITPHALLRDERVLTARTGKVDSALPAGAYRVTLTHGPEWSIVAREVEVRPGVVTPLRVALAREVDARAYTACDLHVHTAESPDSNLQLTERIDTLLAEDVQFAVLTDHNRVTGAVEALAGAGIASLPGVEVTTWAPELGHFNVFPRVTPPRYKQTRADTLLRELRQSADSFVQVNHPRLEGHIGYFELAAFERRRGRGSPAFPLSFDGLEVWNGYDLAAPTRRDEVFRDWLAMVARGQRITATGNSDSHRAGLLPYVGYPRTYVRVPRERAQLPGKVLAALKHGRAFVTNGPILDFKVDGRGPGDTLALGRSTRSLRVHVEVRAPAWMALRELELWLGETLVRRVPLAEPESVASGGLFASLGGVFDRPARGHRQRVSVDLPWHEQRSLVVTVRGAASMKPLVGRAQVTPYAFTNPLWIARR
jgi:predicted metal-dependent phosphoesterase TrpH